MQVSPITTRTYHSPTGQNWEVSADADHIRLGNQMGSLYTSYEIDLKPDHAEVTQYTSGCFSTFTSKPESQPYPANTDPFTFGLTVASQISGIPAAAMAELRPKA